MLVLILYIFLKLGSSTKSSSTKTAEIARNELSGMARIERSLIASPKLLYGYVTYKFEDKAALHLSNVGPSEEQSYDESESPRRSYRVSINDDLISLPLSLRVSIEELWGSTPKQKSNLKPRMRAENSTLYSDTPL